MMNGYTMEYHLKLQQEKREHTHGWDLTKLELRSPYIVPSWHRSLLRGLRPEQRTLNRVDDPVEASALGRSRPLLFEMIHNRLEMMEERGYLSDSVLFSASMEGHITRMVGNGQLLTKLKNDGITVGIDLSEESAGTNAVALCLRQSELIVVQMEEHYLQPFCAYSCVAVPLYDHQNRQVAVLGMVYEGDGDPGHASTVVQLIASSLRRIIQLHYRYIHMQDFESLLETLMENLDFGVLLLNGRQEITRANRTARSVLTSYHYELAGQKIGSLIPEKYIHFPSLRNNVYHVQAVISSLQYDVSVYLVPAHQWSEQKYIVTLHRPGHNSSGLGLSDTHSIQEVEEQVIRQALNATQGNVKLAAEKLGISRRTLYRRISEYNIDNRKGR